MIKPTKCRPTANAWSLHGTEETRFQNIEQLAFASGHSREYYSTDPGVLLGRVEVMPIPRQLVAVCTVAVARVLMMIGDNKRDMVWGI